MTTNLVAAPGCLVGQIVTITGTTENFTYKGYREIIKKLGGIYTEYVSNRTTMLIYGTETEDGLPIEYSKKFIDVQKENTKAATGERGYKLWDEMGKLLMGNVEIYSEEEFAAWLESTATPQQRATARLIKMKH